MPKLFSDPPANQAFAGSSAMCRPATTGEYLALRIKWHNEQVRNLMNIIDRLPAAVLEMPMADCRAIIGETDTGVANKLYK